MIEKSQLKVDSIVDVYGISSPELPYSAVIPPEGTLNVNGNINVVGVSTMADLRVDSVVSQSIVATAFVGDGSGLTGLPIVNDSKVVGLSLIF